MVGVANEASKYRGSVENIRGACRMWADRIDGVVVHGAKFLDIVSDIDWRFAGERNCCPCRGYPELEQRQLIETALT